MCNISYESRFNADESFLLDFFLAVFFLIYKYKIQSFFSKKKCI